MFINSSWKWCSYSASCSNVWSSRPIIWLWFDSNSTAWFDSDTGLEIDRFFSCLFKTFLIQSNFWDLCIFSNGHDIVIFTRKVYQQIRAWFRVSLTLFDQNIHVQHFPSFSLDWVRRNFEISKKLLLFTNIWYIHYWHDRIL